jgi:hypothetical protein
VDHFVDHGRVHDDVENVEVRLERRLSDVGCDQLGDPLQHVGDVDGTDGPITEVRVRDVS